MKRLLAPGVGKRGEKRMKDSQKRRCAWCNPGDSLYTAYHDEEWGVELHDDRRLFELLVLESFQAGLSWACILHKRAAFREAFDGFVPEKVAAYDEAKLEELRQNPKIVRNRLKILAAVTNARVFLAIAREFGSFDAYLWSHTSGRIVRETGKTSSPLSDKIAADLHRRGMKFVGTTIIYAFLQAAGVVFSHEKGCWLASRE